jgi:hypothetical protein
MRESNGGSRDAHPPDAPPDDGAREPDRKRLVPAFLVGALVGMVALALVWATTTLVADGAEGTDGTDVGRVAAGGVTSTPSAGTEPSQQPQASPRPSRRERCRQAVAELAVPLRVAAPALDQWAIHVGAMNKLVLGAITPEQAAEFWAETKVGALRNLDRFDAATRRASGAWVDCPSSKTLAQASGALRSCAQHVSQDRRTLEVAEVALRTWKAHIRDMRMQSMGHLSPGSATQRWLANWQRGIRELRAFQSAQRAAGESGSC